LYLLVRNLLKLTKLLALLIGALAPLIGLKIIAVLIDLLLDVNIVLVGRFRMGFEFFTLTQLTKAGEHSIITEILFRRSRRTNITYALAHLGKCNVTRSVSTLPFLTVGRYVANTVPINLGFFGHYLYVLVIEDP
jgi:hypothetical protein